MKFSLAVMAAALVGVNAVEVTPTQKVVQLLEGMLAKGKEEKHQEQVTFAAYKQFCDDTSVEKARDIKEAEELMAKLDADAKAARAHAAKLGREIAAHEADIATWQGDQAAATKVRSMEKTDYDTMHKDYSESVDALERAIGVLKKQAYDRPQAEALLLQLAAVPMKTEQKSALTAFLQQEPTADGYEFQSTSIIDMLEKLLDEFVDQRTNLEKEEMNSKHAYDMLMQDLTAQIQNAEAAVSDKKATKGAKLQAAADAESDYKDTKANKEEDEKYLADLTATCEQKASDFENRQQLRADELVAIQKAIEILSSGAVMGNAEKHLPQMFLQMKVAHKLSNDENQWKAVEYLKMRATQLNSRILSQLVQQSATAGVSADPFKKVKKMIKDLIVRLMEEANEEAEHKGWCDTELATNEATRKEKTQAVETLHAEIDQLESSIAKLNEEITELTAAVAALDKAMAEATELRTAEKAKNEETIKDATEAQAAVAQALTVLKEFYAKAAEATSLLQQPETRPDAPEIFDSEYKGMQSENGGVVGMLEVIESDFARLEADTKAAEEAAQKEYDSFMDDSTVDKASKNTSIEHKTAKMQDEEQALAEKKSDLEGTQKELDAALAYFDKLKPSCISTGTSYEDRVARREEEIQSLQEALRILNGEA